MIAGEYLQGVFSLREGGQILLFFLEVTSANTLQIACTQCLIENYIEHLRVGAFDLSHRHDLDGKSFRANFDLQIDILFNLQRRWRVYTVIIEQYGGFD